MKKRKILWLAFVLAFMCLFVQETTFAAEPYEKIANANEWAVLKKVNRERLAQGLVPLGIFDSLQDAAGARAEEISDYFSHSRPDGTSCFTILDDYDVEYTCAGENIAAGYQSATSVMSGWMNSPGHKRNILGSSYTHIGIGYATGGYYGKNWTQLLVGSCKVKSVTVNDKGTPNYAVGTSIDKMNRYLIVKCDNHGTSYVPITSKMCKGYNANKKGYQTVTVKYRGKKVKMDVTVGSSSSYQKPYQVKNLKVTAKSDKAVRLSWSKRKGSGYEVWMATSKNGTYKKVKALTSYTTKKCRVTGLESGKKYYFKVRAYKKSGSKKIYGLFSEAVVVKTK